MKPRTQDRLVAGAIGAFLGSAALYLWLVKTNTAPGTAPAPAAPPLGQGVSALSGAVTITVAPGTITQALEVNTAVILYLPSGGKWVSMDGAGITDRTSPQALVFLGPISHGFVWTDARNTTQTTNVDLTVAPPSGVVTA
jgi:hypothetical protein